MKNKESNREVKEFSLLFEIHPKECTCSYCYGDSKLHNGLNLPKNKGWTSWRVIKIGRLYIRWTMPHVSFSYNYKGNK